MCCYASECRNVSRKGTESKGNANWFLYVQLVENAPPSGPPPDLPPPDLPPPPLPSDFDNAWGATPAAPPAAPPPARPVRVQLIALGECSRTLFRLIKHHNNNRLMTICTAGIRTTTKGYVCPNALFWELNKKELLKSSECVAQSTFVVSACCECLSICVL